jgi:hypothetical protein
VLQSGEKDETDRINQYNLIFSPELIKVLKPLEGDAQRRLLLELTDETNPFRIHQSLVLAVLASHGIENEKCYKLVIDLSDGAEPAYAAEELVAARRYIERITPRGPIVTRIETLIQAAKYQEDGLYGADERMPNIFTLSSDPTSEGMANYLQVPFVRRLRNCLDGTAESEAGVENQPISTGVDGGKVLTVE